MKVYLSYELYEFVEQFALIREISYIIILVLRNI